MSLDFIAAQFADALLESGLAGNGAVAQLCPESNAASLPIPGGYAFFNGAKDSATRALVARPPGLVTEEQIDELETFFRTRNAKVGIFILDESSAQDLLRMLVDRGYQREREWHALRRSLPATTAAITSGIDIVRVDVSDAQQLEIWARSVAAGFRELDAAIRDGDIEDWEVRHDCARGSVMNWQLYLAECAGEPAGGARLQISDRVALLRSASTRFNYRGRGIQSALITHRLLAASEAGCEVAFTIAEAGGVSERNLQRFGFEFLHNGCTYSLP